MNEWFRDVVHLERSERALVRPTPGLEHRTDSLSERLELCVLENRLLHARRFKQRVTVPCAIALRKQCITQRRKHLPIVSKRVDVAIWDAAVQVRVEVLEVLRFGGVDVPRNVEIVIVSGVRDLRHRYDARVSWHLDLPVEDVHNSVDVLRTQTIFVSVLQEAFARVDHENAGARMRVLLINYHNARRDTGAVE